MKEKEKDEEKDNWTYYQDKDCESYICRYNQAPDSGPYSGQSWYYRLKKWMPDDDVIDLIFEYTTLRIISRERAEEEIEKYTRQYPQ